MTVFKTSHAQDNKSIKQNVFVFQVSGSDEVFEIPLRQYISADLADRLSEAALPLQPLFQKHQDGTLSPDELPEPEKLMELKRLQREIFDTYAPGAYKAAHESEINELMQEWGRRSSVSLGESSASSGS